MSNTSTVNKGRKGGFTDSELSFQQAKEETDRMSYIINQLNVLKQRQQDLFDAQFRHESRQGELENKYMLQLETHVKTAAAMAAEIRQQVNTLRTGLEFNGEMLLTLKYKMEAYATKEELVHVANHLEADTKDVDLQLEKMHASLLNRIERIQQCAAADKADALERINAIPIEPIQLRSDVENKHTFTTRQLDTLMARMDRYDRYMHILQKQMEYVNHITKTKDKS